MTTIYLHFGRAKTGTTVLQGWLSRHRDWLRARGVHYLDTADRGRGGGHQQFAKSFITRLPDYMTAPAHPERTLGHAREELAGIRAPAIVISSENFPLADGHALRRFLEEVRPDARIKILFFARSQDELAESQFNQMVKLKRETRSFNAFAHAALQGEDYLALTEQWEAVFGRDNIVCRIYDARQPRIIDTFLALLPELHADLDARPADSSPEDDRSNVGVGIQALTLMRWLNRLELDDRATLYRDIARQFASSDWPAVLFASKWGRRFRARYAASNRRFTKRYFGRARADLGGRRYTDKERDRLRREIRARFDPDVSGDTD